KPDVGHTLFHIITAGAADQLFQLNHYLGSLAACSTLRCQYHVQLAAHLIKQDAACVLGKFLEFAGIHLSPTQPFNRTALELASHLTGQLYSFLCQICTRLPAWISFSQASRCFCRYSSSSASLVNQGFA